MDIPFHRVAVIYNRIDHSQLTTLPCFFSSAVDQQHREIYVLTVPLKTKPRLKSRGGIGQMGKKRHTLLWLYAPGYVTDNAHGLMLKRI